MLNPPVRFRVFGQQRPSNIKRRYEQKSRYYDQLYLRSVDEDRQTLPPTQRSGHQELKIALVDMQKQKQQEMGIQFIPTSERKRLNNQIVPSLQKYLEWTSTHWAENFA